MSNQQDNQTPSAEQANAELLHGLSQCHKIVGDYRARLAAAKNNDPDFMLRNGERDENDGEHTG